jgi:hypothetical protein
LLRKFQTLAYEEYAAVLNFPCALQLAHLRENRESAPSAALLRKFQTLAYEEYAAVLNFPCALPPAHLRENRGGAPFVAAVPAVRTGMRRPAGMPLRRAAQGGCLWKQSPINFGPCGQGDFVWVGFSTGP